MSQLERIGDLRGGSHQGTEHELGPVVHLGSGVGALLEVKYSPSAALKRLKCDARGFRGDGDLDRRRGSAHAVFGVAAVLAPDVVSSAGQVIDRGIGVGAAGERENAVALVDRLGAVGLERHVAGGRAGPGDGAADGDGGSVGEAGLRRGHRRGSGEQGDLVPVVDEIVGIDGAEAGGKVIAGGGVVFRCCAGADLAFGDSV